MEKEYQHQQTFNMMGQQQHQQETDDRVASPSQQVVDTSVNNSLQEDEAEQHEENVHNETNEETFIEGEVSRTMHQEADALLRAETQEVILKKERVKTDIVVLEERQNITLEQIKGLRNVLDETQQENEKLNMNVEIERDELQHLQKRLLYNGEILDKFRGYFKTVRDNNKQLRYRSKHIVSDVGEKKKKCMDIVENVNNYQDSISKLKAAIDEKRNKLSNRTDTDENPLKSKISLLKAQLIEKREHAKRLEERCQRIKSKKENLTRLQSQEQELKQTASDLNRKLQEMKDLKARNEIENKARKEEEDSKIKEKAKELNSSLKTIDELKNKLQEKTEEKVKAEQVLKTKEESIVQLEEETAGLTMKIFNRQKEIQDDLDKWKEAEDVAKEALEESVMDLTTIYKENDERKRRLETVTLEYAKKVEEMGEKFVLKSKFEEKLRADEAMLNKVVWLKEKNDKKDETILDFSKKIADIPEHAQLQQLEKEKAYLVSCADYLTEKFENFTAEMEKAKSCELTLKERMDSINKSVEEKEAEYEKALRELESEEAKDSENSHRTPPSILKSPRTLKKFPLSPKKVQFQGVPSSSFESTSSEPPRNTSQQTIVGKSFEDILQEMTENFKSPEKPKPVKKRKVLLDID